MTNRQSISLPPGLLKSKTVDELKEIANNEDSFYTFFSTLQLEEVTKIQSDRDRLMSKNKEISQESLDLRPNFEFKRSKLLDSSQEALNEKENYNELYERLKTMTKAFDQKELLKQLQDRAAHSEREADELTEQYLDGTSQLDVEAFVKTLKDSRTTYWKRKVKAEKMQELFRQGQLQTMPGPIPGPAPVAPYPVPNNLPYQANPNLPTYSLPPTHHIPYPNQQADPNRRSLPTSSIQYQQQPGPPTYQQPNYSIRPSYGSPLPTNMYMPQPQGGYPPPTRHSMPQPQASYRPPSMGGYPVYPPGRR